jgi:hypothetical protein
VHVTIHRVSSLPAAGPAARIGHRDVATLLLKSADLLPLAATFEAAAAALEALPRLYFEPDGSFLWVGEQNAWQIDGQLHDRGETLDYVELKGHCPASALACLLRALRTADETLIFHAVREGVFVDERAASVLLRELS